MVAPSGEGAVRCMQLALETVKGKVDYINPHATSTPVGDVKEMEAIRAVFGAGDKCPPISATKSLTGHSLGATGVQESIYCILMMQNRFLCESANIEELDPAFADMPILRQRRDNVDIGIALSNSFGFGGTNATLVFKHPDAQWQRSDRAADPFAKRARSVTALSSQLGKPRPAVIEQQAADQRLAEPGDQLDRLHGHQRADDAGDGAEHPDHFAGGQVRLVGGRRDRGR